MQAQKIVQLILIVSILIAPSVVLSAVQSTAPSFSVFPGQVVSLGRVVHVRVPGATDVQFFFQSVDRGKRILLGQDDGTHPPLANGPDCEGSPCTVPDEFTVVLGQVLKNVKDGPAVLQVVSPIGSGHVVATRTIYWARYSPRATFQQPAFGAKVPQTGIKVVARTQNANIVDIKVYAVRPNGSCPLPKSDVPRFEQHWLGTDLGYDGHLSCAPTSVAAAFQFLEDNGLANVVPNYSDCGLVEDCADPTKLVQSRCFVTDLGEFLDTNGVTSGNPDVFGSPTPLIDGVANFLHSHFGYTEGVDYEGNDETWGGASGTGFSPQRIAVEYFAGGAYVVGGNNSFYAQPGDPLIGHFVAVNKVEYNSQGNVELTIMEVHTALGNEFPHCGEYKTYTVAANGTIPYVLLPDNFNTTFVLRDIVTFRSFGGSTPGCGPTIPVAGKMINLKWWEGVFVPPDSGPYLLYSETLDSAGHKTRGYQYVVAMGQ